MGRQSIPLTAGSGQGLPQAFEGSSNGVSLRSDVSAGQSVWETWLKRPGRALQPGRKQEEAVDTALRHTVRGDPASDRVVGYCRM